MANEWYYAFEGASKGPFTEDEFNALIDRGTIGRDTLVWREGMDDWLPWGRTANAVPDVPMQPAPAMGRATDPARADARTFLGALKDGFARYVDFRTRSSRPQFWWWTLWSVILSVCASILDGMLGMYESGPINSLLSLVLLLPSIAVAVRRLHDTGRTGWWYLLILIPIIGWIVLLVFYCQKSEPGQNQWGPRPRRRP